MNLPTVKFKNITLSKEIDLMCSFLFDNEWGWGKYIVKKHPKIKKIFLLKNKTEKINFLRQYIVEFKKNNKQLIKRNIAESQREWKRVEKDFFVILSEIIQIKWPENRKIITAEISINPICPRFLDDWSFSIFCNYKKISHAMETIMHETCHFLYFEKWKELYPEMNNEKFESPNIEWHLSEIIAPIILNDNRVQKLLKQKAFFYSEHMKIKIGNKTVPTYFTDLYIENLNENDFVGFLRKSYQIIQENKKKFLEIKK